MLQTDAILLLESLTAHQYGPQPSIDSLCTQMLVLVEGPPCSRVHCALNHPGSKWCLFAAELSLLRFLVILTFDGLMKDFRSLSEHSTALLESGEHSIFLLWELGRRYLHDNDIDIAMPDTCSIVVQPLKCFASNGMLRSANLAGPGQHNDWTTHIL